MGLPPRPTGGLARTLGRYEYICEIARSFFGPLWAAKPVSGEGEGLPATVRRVSTAEIGAATVDAVCEGAWWGMEVEHRGVARVVDVVVGEDEVGIVTDYFEGEALRALLRQAGIKRKPFSESAALRVGKDLLLALEAVHAAGTNLSEDEPFVFGGVSPDTVFLGTDGEVRIADVGLATIVSGLEAFAKHADRAAYLAPELFSDGARASASADVFSVGVILWEMLSNRRLFVGASHDAIALKVKSAAIPRLDELKTPGADPVSATLASIVARALEREPSARYETVGEMLAAVDGSGLLLGSVGDSGQLVAELAEVSIGPRRRAIDKATGSDEKVPLSARFRSRRPAAKQSGATWTAAPGDAPRGPASPFASPPAPPVASPPAPPVASPPAPPVASPPPPHATPSPAPTDTTAAPSTPPSTVEPDTLPRPDPPPRRPPAKQTMLGMPSPLGPPPLGASPPPLPVTGASPPPLPVTGASPSPPAAAGPPPPRQPAPPGPAGKRTMLGMPSPLAPPPAFGSEEASTMPSVRDIHVSRIEPPSEPPPSIEPELSSLDAISIHDVEPLDSSDAPTLPPKDVPPPPAFLTEESGTLASGAPKKEVDAWVKALTTPVDDEDAVEQAPAISMPIDDGPVSSFGAAMAFRDPSAAAAADSMDQAFARARDGNGASDFGSTADADAPPVVPDRTKKLRVVVGSVVGGLAVLAILALLFGRTKPAPESVSAEAKTPVEVAPAPAPAPAPVETAAAPPEAPPGESASPAPPASEAPAADAGRPPQQAAVEPKPPEAPAPAAQPAPARRSAPAPREAPVPRAAPKKPRKKFTPDDI